MKLTAKFAAFLLMAIAIILFFDGAARVRRAVALFDRELPREAQAMGRAMRPLVKEAWQTHGPEHALKLLGEADHKEDTVSIRWVWLDAGPGDPHGPQAAAERVRTVVGEELVSLKEVGSDGEEYLYTYVPVAVDPQRRGAIELGEPLSPVREFVRGTIHRELALAGTIAIASALAVSVLGVLLVGRPLKALMDKTERIGSGDLSGPVELRSRDELAMLARALNEMCERLAEAQERVRAETEARIGALEQLRHADRLATVGRLATGLAHELGTPLNVVMGRAGMIAKGALPASEAAASADVIRSQVERMTHILRQLLSFARPRKPKRTSADLVQIAQQTLELMEPLARKKDVVLTLVGEQAAASAKVDAAQVQQVLMNLVDNALAAVGKQGSVEIGIGVEHAEPPQGVDAAEGDYIRAWVRDDGAGIPEENLPHLFEPFFTTKDVGEGTGLGLSISYGIVREHGGWIGVESKPGEGSCFSVYLPKGE